MAPFYLSTETLIENEEICQSSPLITTVEFKVLLYDPLLMYVLPMEKCNMA